MKIHNFINMKQIFIPLIAVSFILISCETNFIKKENSIAMKAEDSTTRLTLATVERFNAAFNRHDAAEVMKNMTEDCVFENTSPQPDGTRLVGAAAIKTYWEKFFTNNPECNI